jgi:SAM-dependent methyltransferase
MTSSAVPPPPSAGPHWSASLLDSAARLAEAVSARAEGDARWRRALVSDMDPRDCDVVLDARCGHGALTLALAEAAPKAIILGLDHREAALQQARARAAAAGAKINLIHGFPHDIASYVNELRPTRIVCTLSEADDHAARKAILAAARSALAARGTLHIVEAAGPAPRFIEQIFSIAPAPAPKAANQQPIVDMLRQSGFVGVMDLGVFVGQTLNVRLSRGTAP